jgi:hypothetical protein
MLQQRQIIKALAKQINMEDSENMGCVIASFQSIVWILISVIVTNNRTVPLQRCQIAVA